MLRTGGDEDVSRRIVVGKLLRVVLAAQAPGETVVVALADPIQFFGHVAVRPVFSGEEIAVGGKGQRKGVAHAVGVDITGASQAVLVVGQEEMGAVQGQAQKCRRSVVFPARPGIGRPGPALRRGRCAPALWDPGRDTPFYAMNPTDR
jgi:hypothetical protein